MKVMGRQRPENEGITYNPGDITSPEEGYRELANCIVAQAADDYVTYLLKPNFEKEKLAMMRPTQEAVAIENVIKQIPEDEEAIRVSKEIFLECHERAIKTKYLRRGFVKRLKAVKKQIVKAQTVDELKVVARLYVRFWKDRYAEMRNRDNTRKSIGKDCLRFFRSDDFILYTSGTIDPDRLIEQCEKEAERLRSVRGADYDGLRTY